MESTLERALWLEALSDKVLHQLPPSVWKQLFLDPKTAGIRFEQRSLTLVHVDVDVPAGEPGAATLRFHQELQRLNALHHGRLDPCVDATALATFEEPGASVRMALDLQRAAQGVALRIGVVSGRCMLACFRVQGRLWCTPLGALTVRAAEVAATASVGGIVISPEAFQPVAGEPQAPADSGFSDSELDLSSLLLSPPADDIDIRV